MLTKDEVFEALHQVEDPELGMDIVELGLLYDAEIEGPKVKVIHSLTSMGCPAGPMIQEDIHRVVSELPGVDDVEIELTWDPPWTPERHARPRRVTALRVEGDRGLGLGLERPRREPNFTSSL